MSVSRSCMVRLFALFLLGFVVRVAESAEPQRPNILFVYTDDQSWRTLSCYRDEGARPWVETPNIDRLAAEGVRFTHAYGAAWCTPSRACVLTGLLPHGIQGAKITGITAGSYDPTVCRFWPAELRKAGYHTAMIGKWHFGHDTGYGRDWDHAVVWDQADIHGDWYNDQLMSIDGAPKKVVPGYSTDVYTQFADEYIRRAQQQPWLLWLCYNAPHLPNTVHPRHKSQYTGAEVPVPSDIFGTRPDKPRYMQEYTVWQKAPDGGVRLARSGGPLPEMVRGYNRLVSAVDEGIGKLVATLKETGQLDNTLIVFTSDQGFAWGEHGFAWKVGPYDACLRMPLIFRLPDRVAQGKVCRQPATVVDLAPTFFHLAGLPVPWTMHGHDLTPLLKDPEQPFDMPAVMEFFQWQFGAQTDKGLTEEKLIGGIPWWIFLRQGQYKYIRTLVPDEVEELYDLAQDPDELKNLARDATHRELLEDFRGRLLAELRRTNAGLLENLPEPRVVEQTR